MAGGTATSAIAGRTCRHSQNCLFLPDMPGKTRVCVVCVVGDDGCGTSTPASSSASQHRDIAHISVLPSQNIFCQYDQPDYDAHLHARVV